MSEMLYFTPGSHAYFLLSLLSTVHEFPLSSIHLLGPERVIKARIRSMCEPLSVRHTETGEVIHTRLLNISGKGADRTIRLSKGALPILTWMDEGAAQACEQYKYRGDRAHVLRNHRVAEAVAMSMRARVAVYNQPVAAISNCEETSLLSDSPAFYTSRCLKDIKPGESKKTLFTRLVGALVLTDVCHAVYNTRSTVMKWCGMGEFKARFALTELARSHADIRQVDSAILFGDSYEIALQTLMESDRSPRHEFRFDSIYPHIHFIPLNDFGIRLLRLMCMPEFKERLLDRMFYKPHRSFNRGAFEYDAVVDGRYIFTHFDGDLARLVRFRDAMDDRLSRQCQVLCFPEQRPFLRSFLGEDMAIQVYSIETLEAALRK